MDTNSEAFVALTGLRRKLAFRCAAVAVGSLLFVVLLMRFAPHLLALPLAMDGRFTLGMAMSLGVFIACVAATAWYVHRANQDLETLLDAVRREHGR